MSARLLLEPLALGRREQHFWGVNVHSAPREVVSLVVTHQWCEKWASDATHSWNPLYLFMQRHA